MHYTHLVKDTVMQNVRSMDVALLFSSLDFNSEDLATASKGSSTSVDRSHPHGKFSEPGSLKTGPRCAFSILQGTVLPWERYQGLEHDGNFDEELGQIIGLCSRYPTSDEAVHRTSPGRFEVSR